MFHSPCMPDLMPNCPFLVHVAREKIRMVLFIPNKNTQKTQIQLLVQEHTTKPHDAHHTDNT